MNLNELRAMPEEERNRWIKNAPPEQVAELFEQGCAEKEFREEYRADGTLAKFGVTEEQYVAGAMLSRSIDQAGGQWPDVVQKAMV